MSNLSAEARLSAERLPAPLCSHSLVTGGDDGAGRRRPSPVRTLPPVAFALVVWPGKMFPAVFNTCALAIAFYGSLFRVRSGQIKSAIGSGSRYMIRVTLLCTLCESKNTRTCEDRTQTHGRFACPCNFCVRFSHVRVCFLTCMLKCVRFSHVRVCFDSRNEQKRATKSDTWG